MGELFSYGRNGSFLNDWFYKERKCRNKRSLFNQFWKWAIKLIHLDLDLKSSKSKILADSKSHQSKVTEFAYGFHLIVSMRFYRKAIKKNLSKSNSIVAELNQSFDKVSISLTNAEDQIAGADVNSISQKVTFP